jgi:hypothetical protein
MILEELFDRWLTLRLSSLTSQDLEKGLTVEASTRSVLMAEVVARSGNPRGVERLLQLTAPAEPQTIWSRLSRKETRQLPLAEKAGRSLIRILKKSPHSVTTEQLRVIAQTIPYEWIAQEEGTNIMRENIEWWETKHLSCADTMIALAEGELFRRTATI